jgi:hypothetical protein
MRKLLRPHGEPLFDILGLPESPVFLIFAQLACHVLQNGGYRS